MDKSQTNFNKQMKVAVVTNDDYIKEITSEYDQVMIGSKWVTRIFPSYELAKKWVSSK